MPKHASPLLLLHLDFIEHRLKSDVFLDLAQLGMVGGRDVEMRRHGLDHLGELGQFVLGKQTDMQVEISPLVRGFRHTVLADQDEGRKKDGLEGAVVASPAKEGSNFGAPGSIPKAASTHAP